jgi:hypothetical protein
MQYVADSAIKFKGVIYPEGATFEVDAKDEADLAGKRCHKVAATKAAEAGQADATKAAAKPAKGGSKA